MDEERYHNLIHKSLSDEINSEEQKELDLWIKSSGENKKIFEDIKNVWLKVENSEPNEIPSMEMVWENIDKKISGKIGKPETNIIPIASTEKTSPKSIFNITGNITKWWSAAAAVFIIVFTAYLLDLFSGKIDEQIYFAANGEKIDVELNDGSLVKLNSGSKLVVSEEFNENERVVNLIGQAFFDVEHDGSPFIIITENAKVKVVGTSFDVWARNKITKIIVKEGKVLFGNRNSKLDSAVALTANQSSICNEKENPSLPETINSTSLLGWLNNEIVFDKTPIWEIASELERRFDVKINLTNVNDSLSLTGSFEESGIEPVLETICLALNLSYKYEADKYVIF